MYFLFNLISRELDFSILFHVYYRYLVAFPFLLHQSDPFFFVLSNACSFIFFLIPSLSYSHPKCCHIYPFHSFMLPSFAWQQSYSFSFIYSSVFVVPSPTLISHCELLSIIAYYYYYYYYCYYYCYCYYYYYYCCIYFCYLKLAIVREERGKKTWPQSYVITLIPSHTHFFFFPFNFFPS